MHRLYSPDCDFHQRVDVASHAVGNLRGALDVYHAVISPPLLVRRRWQSVRRRIRIEQGVLRRFGRFLSLGGEGVVELDDRLVGIEALALYLRPDGEAVEGRAARQGDIEHTRAEHLGVDGAVLEGLNMPTVSEIDGKLDELKRQAAALKEQRKVAAAKEREQARKWKAATLAAIGETVLKTLGADWTAIDLEGLQGWLAESAEDIRLMAVTDTRTPVEAKEALDAFKRSSKPKRTGKPDAVDDVTEMPETIDMAEDEKQADW